MTPQYLKDATRAETLTRATYPLADFRIDLPGPTNVFFSKKPRKTDILCRLCCLSVIYECLKSFLIKSHWRCYTRLWRPKPRQAESA